MVLFLYEFLSASFREFLQTTQDFAVELGFESLQVCLTQLLEHWS